MVQYIHTKIGMGYNQANKLRENYWQQYGSTLRGLIRNYSIDPTNFLEETHDLPNINALIYPMKNLKKTLSGLKGRKLIYTNGPKSYALSVLRACRLLKYFDAVHSIEDSFFNGKPSRSSMKHFLVKNKIKRAVFIDDEVKNLKTASYYGIKTVWLNKGCKKPYYITKKIRHLDDLLNIRI